MVSVIIPVYNVEKYLNQCVESVLKLKSDFEIVLVDDGSTDKSGELCDSLAKKDSRIKVIHKENGGLSSARNAGIENASGEYLMFLDSDDFLNPEETDLFLSNSDKSPLLLGLYNLFFEERKEYVKENCDSFLNMSGLINIDDFLSRVPYSSESCYMIACRFAVNRGFVLNNGLFFTQGIYHEDEEWTQRLLSCSKNIFVTHNYFYNYRQAREGAITSTVKPKHIFDIFKIIDNAKKLISDPELSTVKKEYLLSRLASLYLNNLIHYYSLPKAERKKAKKLLLENQKLCTKKLQGKFGTPVKISLTLFGISLTCRLLNLAHLILK